MQHINLKKPLRLKQSQMLKIKPVTLAIDKLLKSKGISQLIRQSVIQSVR